MNTFSFIPRCRFRGSRATYGVKVNHLAADVSETELKSQFSQFGVIRDGKVRIRKGHDENYAYVNYCSLRDAERAAAAMNEKEIHGKRVSVKVQRAGGESTKESYAVKVSSLAKHEPLVSFMAIK